ncbi:DUF4345 domain-containing protein [Curtobacterium sp. MCLR17_034]|uniref:DUF4345 domain-containing protein n=1 Tax=Curtobacterium sp. MCLR17_034 TaxID=2175623 RepID=UPI0015E8A081|nr:DUF4345 domain-containing protein [Curtobacterium sp. MCLR17_034]
MIDRQHPAPAAREAPYRAVLVVLLTVVGAIAVVGGVGMVLGAVTGPEEQHVAVSTSSEYRFLSGVWLVLGLALWWSLVQPASRVAVTRVVLIAAIGGGVGRLVSLLVEGWPGPFTAALAIELLALPVLLVWHVRAFKRAVG